MPKILMRQKLRQRRDEFATMRASLHDFSAPPDPLRNWITQSHCVSGYVPFGSEASPLALLAYARRQGRETALPHVTHRDAPMRFLRWQMGDTLYPGPFGVMQPADDAPEATPDLIVTPLLGFDRRCRRLGYGAGFYDRAFAQLPTARRVGLAWSVQEVDVVPADSWDVALHAIWTECDWIVNEEMPQ
ncbi:5-formyltetrahydrofolate cyclo-ligase [Sphingomonas sp. LaA6.9]|uniref:5-formyltetrahydrofolate cyclo-ligase n=1 Tax=Sphingomonas sp. LaA6.9 TaxID=2919914 RepID=UPI001F4F5779|nr:5-formyltetrahydrofolate cyclo-ligase [Sphingomonas sp. LaA6.9]MCJ8156016.1 5-formyltetrahydrofolate cyclo-ligase [Sphingomonas sp. LaA6.9]